MPPVQDYDYVEALTNYLAMGEHCRNRPAVEEELLSAARELGPDGAVAVALLAHGDYAPAAIYFERHGPGVLEGRCPLGELCASAAGPDDTLRILELLAPDPDATRETRIRSVTRLATAHDAPSFLEAGLKILCDAPVEDMEILSVLVRGVIFGPRLAADFGRRIEASFDARDAAWRRLANTALAARQLTLPVALLKMAVPVTPLLNSSSIALWQGFLGCDEAALSAHQRLALAQRLPEIRDLLSNRSTPLTTLLRNTVAEIDTMGARA